MSANDEPDFRIFDAGNVVLQSGLTYRGACLVYKTYGELNAERNNAIAPDIAAPLIAAVVKTTGIVKIETIEPMIANKAAFRAALDQLHIMPLGAAVA